MNNHRQGGLPILAVTFLMLVSALVAGGLVFYWQTGLLSNSEADNASNAELQDEITTLQTQIGSLQKDVQYDNDTVVQPVGSPNVNATTGTLEGTVSFPSEGIPADMEVCATNQGNQQETCTQPQLSTKYSLKVPPGSYQVFARSKSFNPNYKAYYSQFVTCGLKASCPSHDPITVAVEAGKIVTGVDPQDWYKTP
jgi:hypothetical protein